MIAVSVIDSIAALFVLFGAVMVFGPRLLLRLGSRALGRPGEPILTPDQRSVFRMIGIMVMAFAFTFAAFSTLIFVFSRSSSLR